MSIIKLNSLASHLVYHRLLSEKLAYESERLAKEANQSLISYLVQHQILDNETIIKSFQKNFAMTTFDLSQYNFNWLVASKLNNEFIRRYQILPLMLENNLLSIAIADPTDRATLNAIAFHTGYQIKPTIVLEKELLQFIQQHFSSHKVHHLEINHLNNISSNDSPIEENTSNPDEPIIRFVDQLIQHAIQQKVSDIHIEPFQAHCLIRYRIDGLLYEKATLAPHLAARISMRLKVMARCDIAERRLPQDGKFQLQSRDIRMNICPTIFGEKIVLRLLNPNHLHLEIDSLQLSDAQKQIFLAKISEPQGLILVTGPTGSGKTITLYTALHYLNASTKNISTVEDPVEIQLPGINQVNIHPKIGLHFSTVLRTLLRQDPDIMMIGEIRDSETATIATQAALTGHLVLSTLHTTNAIEVMTRLTTMGVAADNIVNSLSLIVAQRLIRTLCVHCKQPYSHQNQLIYQAVGCKRCLNGFSGRIGIYELIPINAAIKTLLLRGKISDISRYLQKINHQTLRESANEKISNGISSITEVNRVLQAEA